MIEYCTSLNVRPDGTENRCDGNDCTTLPDHAAETFQLFTEGDDLYASMLSAIAGAKESIRLESYIFADDAVGNRFCQALIERAQAGIVVRVHIDAAG